MPRFHKVLFLIALFAAVPVHASRVDTASRAVVKLTVTNQDWNLTQPWSKNNPVQATCSGFVIAQGILTNAHCVYAPTYVQVEFQGVPDRVEAEVVAVNPQVDLALLRPTERSPLSNIKPITFGDLPDYREKVVTVGYPTGGQQISYTEGVVSRVDVMQYAHSGMPSLMVQTDAAINPGNSGGPVFSDRSGECLGVATQKSSFGEGLGYFVPTPVIRQFLADAADGNISGIPNLGIEMQTIENAALRRHLGLREDQTGVRVQAIARGGSADGVLEIDDVILAIDGHPVYNDGRVPFRNSKIGMGVHIYTRMVGDVLRLRISRAGVEREVPVTLKPYLFAVVPALPEYGQPPRYRIVGGMVFMVVEPRYLARWGGAWSDKLPLGIAPYLRMPRGQDDLEELIVISDIYDARVNKGYGPAHENQRVVAVGGVPIHRLADLDKAFAAADTAPAWVIDLEGGTRVVLDRSEAAVQDEEIRARYNIKK